MSELPVIDLQRPSELPAVEALLDLAFGAERRARPSYRLREGRDPIAALSLVARDRGAIAATLRFWPIAVGGRDAALLLGPLAVRPDWRGRGLASALIADGLARAKDAGHEVVVAIGYPALFARFGFRSASAAGLIMPVPVEDARFLAAELRPGALAKVSGVLGPARGCAPGVPEKAESGVSAAG